MEVQFYTSRGFAVFELNYGGSTGYGREFRKRLNGQWGVVDVQGAVNCARYLVDQGLADPDHTIIRGEFTRRHILETVTVKHACQYAVATEEQE